MRHRKVLVASALMLSGAVLSNAQDAFVGTEEDVADSIGVTTRYAKEAPTFPALQVGREYGTGLAASTPLLVAHQVRGGANGSTLTVRTSEGSDPQIAETAADLGIMARIIRKTVDPGGDMQVPEVGLSRGSRRAYLEGHGPVFSFTVAYAVAPPPREKDAPPERETDSLWDETRSEIWGVEPRRETEPYDGKRVGLLTTRVLESLRYARNIRHLPDDSIVTVIVSGGVRAGSAGWSESDLSVFPAQDTPAEYSLQLTPPGHIQWEDSSETRASGGGGASRLTISAPISAIRAFAPGDMSAREFRGLSSVKSFRLADSELTADVATLTRILDKKVGKVLGDAYGRASAPFLALVMDTVSPRTAAGAAIEGYGILLETEVRMPLVSPAPEEGAARPDAELTLWEQTQREVYRRLDRQGAQAQFSVGLPHGSEGYSADKIASLKDALVGVLKEAGNIKALVSEDSVAVAVRSRGGSPGAQLMIATAGGAMFTTGASDTLLTAHATKRNIDRFASGEMTRAQFMETVTFTRTSAPGATTGGSHGSASAGGGAGLYRAYTQPSPSEEIPSSDPPSR
jgi:hypothetical protein